MNFPETRYAENNMLKRHEFTDEYLVDLNELYLEAEQVDASNFVINQSQDSFDLVNIPPSHRNGWRRWIVCDVVGKTRFSLTPKVEPNHVTVYRSLQGSVYEFHILDFNLKGYLESHRVFTVDTARRQ